MKRRHVSVSFHSMLLLSRRREQQLVLFSEAGLGRGIAIANIERGGVLNHSRCKVFMSKYSASATAQSLGYNGNLCASRHQRGASHPGATSTTLPLGAVLSPPGGRLLIERLQGAAGATACRRPAHHERRDPIERAPVSPIERAPVSPIECAPVSPIERVTNHSACLGLVHMFG